MTLKPHFKPLETPKLQALLLKLRKGATTTFTWRELAGILASMGGSVTPTVGAVHLTHDPERDSSTWAMERTVVEANRAWLYQRRVDALPAVLQPGVLYVLALGEVEDLGARGGVGYSCSFRAHYGAEGYRVELGGKSATFLPSWHEYGRYDTNPQSLRPRPLSKLTAYEALRWLSEETDWVARGCQLLGMEEHVPAPLRTRDGTGTCGACFENVKIPEGKIALHGYRRPGDGHVRGRCPGTDYPAFEVSVDATQHYLDVYARPDHTAALGRLAHYTSGKATEILVGYGRSMHAITPEDPQWAAVLASTIQECENAERRTRTILEAYEELVRYWVPRSLPREGDRQIDWFVKGRVAPLPGEPR